MKAVSILAVTTALSLGGVVLLYVEQQDLKEQFSTSRGSSYQISKSGGTIAPLAEELDDQRIEQMISRVLARMNSEAPAMDGEGEMASAPQPGSEASRTTAGRESATSREPRWWALPFGLGSLVLSAPASCPARRPSRTPAKCCAPSDSRVHPGCCSFLR